MKKTSRHIWLLIGLFYTASKVTGGALQDAVRGNACTLHNQTRSSTSPRIFDLFLSSHEFDLMEIRFHTLYETVDTFIILESRQTFRGKPRHLAFPSVLRRLPGRIINKIRYIVIDELHGSNGWGKEHYQRDSLFTIALKQSGVQAQNGDILLLSDADEIPKPHFLQALRLCNFQYPLVMLSNLNYYAFNLVGRPWGAGPRAILYSEAMPLTATQLRSGSGAGPGGDFHYHANTSWHCSYCFKHVAAFKAKLESFSHSETDIPRFKSTEHIISAVRNGLDLFDRPDITFQKQQVVDAPEYVKLHPDRFGYLLTRDTEDAGFVDVYQKDVNTTYNTYPDV